VARPKLVPPADGFRSIAVLRLSSLGDVILTLPVVHALARAYPRARIHYWTKEEYADLVRHDPAIAHVRALEPDARRLEDLVSMAAELEDADLIVDLHGNTRTRILTFRQQAPVLRASSFRLRRAAQVHARALRPQPPPSALRRFAHAVAPLGVEVSETPHVHAPVDAEAWAATWLEEWTAGERPVALLPGARHFTKRWPEEHWLALLEDLLSSGCAVVCCSSAAEKSLFPALAERISEAPRARWCTEPLPRLAAVLSRASAAVSSDSGLMHLAAARGARVVALFGSTAPELGFAPAGEGHAVLCRHEPCQPCTLHGRESCPKGHFRCMRLITAEQVREALRL
jgi:ADP-heptose:LPS heptosyltransferase